MSLAKSLLNNTLSNALLQRLGKHNALYYTFTMYDYALIAICKTEVGVVLDSGAEDEDQASANTTEASASADAGRHLITCY